MIKDIMAGFSGALVFLVLILAWLNGCAATPYDPAYPPQLKHDCRGGVSVTYYSADDSVAVTGYSECGKAW